MLFSELTNDPVKVKNTEADTILKTHLELTKRTLQETKELNALLLQKLHDQEQT